MSTANTADAAPVSRVRLNTWDSPWLNPKFLIGLGMILLILLMGLAGPLGLWDTTLARVASSPLNVPPVWTNNESPFFGETTSEHPLGTDSDGRDMLAVLLVGAPRSLYIGLVAAGAGMLIGVILGFTAGFAGGWVDAVIRTLADSIITIPALAILIVISAFISRMSVTVLALLLAAFAWPGPTRLLRAQVLSMRERGYVQMARLSGANTFSVLFQEMLPNMLPYLAASLTGNVSGAILAATGLEALGLGDTRIPTMGMTIYHAMAVSALFRGMWWWWGTPIVALIVVFTGLFLMTVGLDEIANPRLRGIQSQ